MKSDNQVLQNQYTNLLLAQKEVGLKKSDYSPSVALSAGMRNSLSTTQLPGTDPVASTQSSSYLPYANVTLSYDLYSGGNRKRALEISKIQEEAAEVGINQMEHALTNELFNLYDYYEVRISLLQVSEKSREAAALHLSLSEEKYKSGVINSFNYRDVQMMYLNALLSKIQAVYNLIDSRIKLTRITGGFLNERESVMQE